MAGKGIAIRLWISGLQAVEEISRVRFVVHSALDGPFFHRRLFRRTVTTFGLPIEGAAVLLGIDALMDMARTSVNVLGNCLATAVVARWEGHAVGTNEQPSSDRTLQRIGDAR